MIFKLRGGPLDGQCLVASDSRGVQVFQDVEFGHVKGSQYGRYAASGQQEEILGVGVEVAEWQGWDPIPQFRLN